MECGVIYIRVCPPKGSPAEWLRYCHIISFAPKSFQQNISHIANDINSKYSDGIIIPMDTMIHPGCTTKPEIVDEVANDMYNQYCEMMDRQGIPDSVRCVYSVGELDDEQMNDVKSTHRLYGGESGYDKVMLKIGRFLDESDEIGIFKI